MNRRFRLIGASIRVWHFSLLLAVLLLFSVSVNAFALKPFQIREYVTDNGGVLAEGTVSQLRNVLFDYAKQTGNQILVVIIPGLEDEDLVDYTEQLFKLNQPGQKGKDNGIILLVALKERKVRIEVGYGLEGPVPDGKAGGIIREQITPYFRAGDFNSGITAGVYGLITAISPEYQLPRMQQETAAAAQPQTSRRFSFPGILIAIILIAIFSFIGRIGPRRRYYRGYSEPGLWGGGSGGGGFGGGGFSGGGGSFGGGGASGGW